MTDANTQEFAGFTVPEQNWFKIPNEFINLVAGIENISELKVILYVLRHTWGYQEYGGMKKITFDEFVEGRKKKDGSRMDKGTGLSRRSVIRGLNAAVEHGYLIVETDDTDKARVKKSYGLRMAETIEDEPGCQDGTPPHNEGCQVDTPEVPTLHPRGVKMIPRSEKDTLETTSGPETLDDTTAKPETQLWKQVLEVCKSQMTKGAFDTHLAGSILLSLEDGQAVIQVKNPLSREWLDKRLREPVARAFASCLGTARPELTFVTAES